MARRWTVLRLGSALFFLGALPASCGGGSTGSGSGPIPFAELEARLVEADCHWRAACGFEPDEAICKMDLLHREGVVYPTLAEEIRAGKVEYDGAAAARCADQLRNRGCSIQGPPDRSLGRVGLPIEGDCAAFLVGTVPPGGTCFLGWECAEHVGCNWNDETCRLACCPGTCGPAWIPLGGDCSAPGASCRDDKNEVCRGSGPRTCMAVPDQEGADCTVTGLCVPPLRCVEGASPAVMTCQRQTFAATGQPCDPNLCDDLRDVCDPSAKICRRLPAVGASCVGPYCVPYAACDPATLTCVRLRTIGEPCDPGCRDGLQCDDQTQLCVPLPPEGPACD